ncbi:hypothetical protein [Bacillus sp. FJAT-27251]|uniref:hypothetical protein n=1 Tax=Bacillus sp. FJAT-27251 TaxID=1684142 RepID=UPI0006A7753B|nr:hypothetical protein [Bacillus sp. FJAT-27251]
MKPVLSCTTEELALLVTLCGQPGMAKGIAENSMGKRSTREWEAIMDATAHQLMLKGIWDDERDAREETPLSDEMIQFVQSFIHSKYMIRCSNLPQQHLLMIHHIEGSTWLSNLVVKNVIHEFAFIGQDEIPGMIKDYYQFAHHGTGEEASFSLSDQAFDLLSDAKNVKKVWKKSSFTPDEKESFEQFLAALEKQQWTLYNISFFHNPDVDANPLLENILFFLPSHNGIWTVEYTNHPDTPVQIKLETLEEWHKLLDGVGFIAERAGVQG